MEKIIDKNGNVGFKDGKHIHRRPQYNCTGKYKEIPRFRLWEEEHVFVYGKKKWCSTRIKILNMR